MHWHVTRIVVASLAIVAAILVIASLKPHATVYPHVNRSWRRLFDSPHRVLYKNWKDCMVEKTASFREDYKETWNKIGIIMEECEKPIVKSLNIRDFSNSDETKRHILPLNKEEHQTVITVGVGHDTGAEELLLTTLGNRVEFFGADPMSEINENLYSKIGKFFHFAVSASPGFSTASVLDQGIYKDKIVVNVDAVYFLTKLIGKNFFDAIWLDAEGAEFGLFDFLRRGGAFDQNGITICQMNIEIHSPNDVNMKIASDFFYRTLDDERYGFFLPVGQMRLFLVNFSDKLCVDKYIPKESGDPIPTW